MQDQIGFEATIIVLRTLEENTHHKSHVYFSRRKIHKKENELHSNQIAISIAYEHINAFMHFFSEKHLNVREQKTISTS
jgi:hypothetical protein